MGSHTTGRGRERRKKRGMVVERKPEDKDICLKGEGKRDEDLILAGDSRQGAERGRRTHRKAGGRSRGGQRATGSAPESHGRGRAPGGLTVLTRAHRLPGSCRGWGGTEVPRQP